MRVEIGSECAGAFLGTRHRRWRLPAVLVASALVLSCASQEYTYKFYGGPARSQGEISLLDLGEASSVWIDGRGVEHADYAHVELLPGTYAIAWACWFGASPVQGASVLVETSGFARGKASATLTLEPGHRYSLHCERTYGCGREIFPWIRDDTEGHLVAGRRKP